MFENLPQRMDITEWIDTGVFTPAEAKAWAKALEGQAQNAAKFKQLGFGLEEATAWVRNTTYSPELCAELKRQGRAPREITTSRKKG